MTYDVSDVPPDLRHAVLLSNIKTEEHLRDMQSEMKRNYMLQMASHQELIDIINAITDINEKLREEVRKLKRLP